MNKLTNFIIFFFVINYSLLSTGASFELSGQKPSHVKSKIIDILKKVGSSSYEDQETKGFAYRLKSPIFNILSFDIFIGTYATNRTIVRVDSYDRMSYVLADVILQEMGHKPFKNKYGTKSVFLADFLTILTPSFGHFYANIFTPISSSNFWLKSLMYLGIDGILLWVGGKTFFTHGFDPFKRGLISTSILLGGHRLIQLFPIHMQVSSHNRFVNLGYTFRF